MELAKTFGKRLLTKLSLNHLCDASLSMSNAESDKSSIPCESYFTCAEAVREAEKEKMTRQTQGGRERACFKKLLFLANCESQVDVVLPGQTAKAADSNLKPIRKIGFKDFYRVFQMASSELYKI